MDVNNDNRDRMQRILEQTRALFLADAEQRLGRLRERIEQWSGGQVSDTELVDDMYRTAHTLKGVALTVGLDGLHRCAEELNDYIIQHVGETREAIFTQHLQTCLDLVNRLWTELERLRGV